MVPLLNASQSSTSKSCQNDGCTADRAIDDSMSTYARTVNSKTEIHWWTATLADEVTIKDVFISTTNKGRTKLTGFKVETKMRESEPWAVCKGPYSVEGEYQPHVLQCNQLTTAVFLRLSCTGKFLLLKDVKVEANGKNTSFSYHHYYSFTVNVKLEMYLVDVAEITVEFQFGTNNSLSLQNKVEPNNFLETKIYR